MKTPKKILRQIQLDVIMIPISIYFAYSYYMLVRSGDASTWRHIVFAAWTLFSIGWIIKLVLDLRARRQYQPPTE